VFAELRAFHTEQGKAGKRVSHKVELRPAAAVDLKRIYLSI
jgi:hypothetical protein